MCGSFGFQICPLLQMGKYNKCNLYPKEKKTLCSLEFVINKPAAIEIVVRFLLLDWLHWSCSMPLVNHWSKYPLS